MSTDLLQKQAEIEAELRGLKEARARNISAGRDSDSTRIIELESTLQGIRDAEAIHVERERKKAADKLARDRKALTKRLNELYPEYVESIRGAEMGARELVGAVLRARQRSEEMRGILHGLLSDRPKKCRPSISDLSQPNFEMRLSGRIISILAGLGHPGNQFGNLQWHEMGIFTESDNWVSKETRLIQKAAKDFLDADEDSSS